MYKVMIACEPHCEGWELTRETFRTDDPNEAIQRSDMHRDQDHRSWVEIVVSEVEPLTMQYSLSASREHSGIAGEYPTMNDALIRLEDYARSFPGELVEVHITKIK
jgi:hypothetical protein